MIPVSMDVMMKISVEIVVRVTMDERFVLVVGMSCCWSVMVVCVAVAAVDVPMTLAAAAVVVVGTIQPLTDVVMLQVIDLASLVVITYDDDYYYY
jgi:hypothetical protein